MKDKTKCDSLIKEMMRKQKRETYFCINDVLD